MSKTLKELIKNYEYDYEQSKELHYGMTEEDAAYNRGKESILEQVLSDLKVISAVKYEIMWNELKKKFENHLADEPSLAWMHVFKEMLAWMEDIESKT